jgi:ATP-dependent DNA ligase
VSARDEDAIDLSDGGGRLAVTAKKSALFGVIAPMEARSEPALPEGGAWWFEPKWDGFRCLAFRDGTDLRLQAKSGKPLGRYFPEVVEALRELKADPFLLDGELLVQSDGRFSFEALQMRLHPSETRIRRLAREIPASLTLFDMLLSPRKGDLRALPLSERRRALETFAKAFKATGGLSVTPGTADRSLAQAWLDDGKIEGVVAKRLDDPYLEGERAMVKVKRIRTADCVVGGFRYATGSKLVGSLLLGLYNDQGLLDHVGFTSGLAAADKPALTERLEALGGGPGFTGEKPGGPSRWATERSSEWTPLKPSVVVEVSFDHVSGGRFRHGTRLLRFRPDKAPGQCRMDQIA